MNEKPILQAPNRSAGDGVAEDVASVGDDDLHHPGPATVQDTGGQSAESGKPARTETDSGGQAGTGVVVALPGRVRRPRCSCGGEAVYHCMFNKGQVGFLDDLCTRALCEPCASLALSAPAGMHWCERDEEPGHE